MNSIDFLEGRRPFECTSGGFPVPIPDPRDLHFQQVLFMLEVENCLPESIRLPEWKVSLVFSRWRARYDLPEFQDAYRLAYMLDHYRSEIASDLYTLAGLDLGDLWVGRRWATLLDVISQFPQGSASSAVMAMDKEYAKMLAEAILDREDDPSEKDEDGARLRGWSSTNSMLADIFDVVTSVRDTLIAVNSEGGKSPAPMPYPRPTTAIERALEDARFNRRKAAHEKLVARVLPSRAQ